MENGLIRRLLKVYVVYTLLAFSAGITDNHSVNVAAFSFLEKEFSPNNSDEDLFIFHPSEKKVKFTFFMTVFIF